MNVGMILEAPFPPDIRVENECRALVEAGHTIHIFSVRCDNKPQYKNFAKNIFVYSFKLPRWLFSKIRVTVLRFPFYNFLWLNYLRKIVRDLNLDAIHVHDLPLAKVGRIIAKEQSIPLILDLHENYPAALKIWKHSKKNLGRYFLSPERWAKYEREAVREADRVIVVIEEAMERFFAKEFDANKFAVVSNTVNLDSFVVHEGVARKNNPQTDLVITYVGGFGPHRGLRLAIMAMPKILQTINRAKLVLVGDGNDKKELQKLASNYDLEGKVVFTGWVPMNDVPKYIDKCDVGIIPHFSSEHTETTIPHKLFQYMYLQKVVVVSNCRPLERIVSETQAGLVFNSGDETDLADAIIKLYENEHLRTRMGENGKMAVLRKYNWQSTSIKLIHLYESLSGGNESK